MKEFSSAYITSLLAPYYSVEDESLIERIRVYISVLLNWNEKISLTKITDPGEIVRFHFGESLFAASSLKIRNGRLADVGSGAGFPGLPLAMALPGVRATLIESNAKKAAFLSEASRQLSNVTVLRSRMEEMKGPEAFDYICARAVGTHASLIRWSQEKLTSKGRLVLFLGEEDAQAVSEISRWNWTPRIKIPNSSRRFILSGSPVR